MKKIRLIIGLLILGSFILIWYYKELFVLKKYNNSSCGIYNDKYPAYMGTNDWTILTVGVQPRTSINHIKNIIGKENICDYGKAVYHTNMLPSGTIGYSFSLKIHPYNDKEKIIKIKENLEKNKIYMYWIEGGGFN